MKGEPAASSYDTTEQNDREVVSVDGVDQRDGLGFPSLLRAFRERAGLSQSALARRAGLDPSFINRLESGQRTADRTVAMRLVAALGLDQADTDRLLAAGGYLPDTLARIGPDDPTLQTVVRILTDERLSPEDRAEFREVIRLLARRWQPDASTPRPSAP
ncbi:MAG: helix-turn-helix transcriptional regulator [Chloroflexi bacterium]|nr:helix-turn-helix transcriptional regulator [Chloroflexota bacterium]